MIRGKKMLKVKEIKIFFSNGKQKSYKDCEIILGQTSMTVIPNGVKKWVIYPYTSFLYTEVDRGLN